MVTNNDKWIRIFDIPNTSKHKKGFTIYKVISMLYPESCPDAVTKVTVWKRYNDFRKLHREIKALHKSFQIKDKLPNLPNTMFFKRFDNEVIEERRQSILMFLEYVAAHFELFTSMEFTKFFQSSHIPADQVKGNISMIRSDLNLAAEPEYSYLSPNSDDEHTISDTDSISTVSSLNISVQISEILLDPVSRGSVHKLPANRVDSSLSLSTSHSSKLSDSITLCSENGLSLDGQIYPTPPNTPGSVISDSSTQYVIEASDHINLAVEYEINKEYESAFKEYKTGIDILLRHVKDDKNEDRRTTIRHKVEKYLLRAEKLYNLYLSPEVKIVQELVKDEPEATPTYPISDLHKYKVIKIVYPGMLVLHSELQQPYYVKVVHKTAKCQGRRFILPENVPYMVKLYNYYDCEDCLFLILQYCSGPKLWDYIKQNFANTGTACVFENDEIIIGNCDISDDNSEDSYTDLINNYTSSRNNPLSSCEEGKEPEIFEENQPQLSTVKSKDVLYQRKSSDLSFFGDDEEIDMIAVPLTCIVKWAAQLLLAVESLHNLDVICYDLHSDNLLIDENGDLVLTYMYVMDEMPRSFTNKNDFHLAPEVYSFEPLRSSVDWWSYGIILYELLIGTPLRKIYPQGLSAHSPLKMPKHISAEGRSLLKQLLTYDCRDRLGNGVNGIEGIKSHPFFGSVSWDALTSKCN